MELSKPQSEIVYGKMKTYTLSLVLLGFCIGVFASKLTPQHRIVNGRDARIGQFPYQLSLRRSTMHICGASVLDSSWAITAAHCIDGFEKIPQIFTLRIGSIFRAVGGRVMGVVAIYKHPSYSVETMNFDVAILRTPSNALRFNNVAPIKLPGFGDTIVENMSATVSGWGHMTSSDIILANALKYTVVSTVDQSTCDDDLKYQGGITEAMFCAAAKNTDACQGDSGGPIVANNTLIGVVSWGVGCADPNYPGVYTRLSYPPIRDWLRLLSKL